MEDLTPMMKQYHEVKARFPGKLVFFRLGDFYEMFFEDAVLASRELEITLTSRNKDKNGAPIPMCGVPHHSVDGYIARLMKKGFKIAICEQVESAKASKKLVRREVTRVLTPGTVLEDREGDGGRAVVRGGGVALDRPRERVRSHVVVDERVGDALELEPGLLEVAANEKRPRKAQLGPWRVLTRQVPLFPERAVGVCGP